jgi:hypothetical protein
MTIERGGGRQMSGGRDWGESACILLNERSKQREMVVVWLVMTAFLRPGK